MRQLILMASLFTCFACTKKSYAVTPKDTVALAWESAPRTADSRYAVDADSQYLENLIHCSLIAFGEEGQPIGDLAAKWEWTNPTTLTVTLNPARFSDGTAVSSSDVKATYDFFKRKDVTPASARAGAFTMIAEVQAPSPTSVVFKLTAPDATFITNLVVGILPTAAAQGAMIASGKPVTGCGPFVLKSTDVTGLVLEKNTHYSLGSPPKIARADIKIVKDETTRFAKLRKGEIDIVQNLLGRDKLAEIEKGMPQLKILKRPGLNTAYLGFNMRDPILKNVKVRRAIAQAINRDLIIKHVLNGLAVPAATLLPPSHAFFNKDLKPAAFDTKEAMRLLDEAGFKDPDGAGPQPRFTLTYKTTTNDTRIQVAKAIGTMLKDIGIQVNVQSLEWGKFKDDVEKGQVQLWSLNWIGFKDPDIYRYAFATESFPPNGGNRGWYSNAELDKLLAAGRATTDEPKRREIYANVLKLVDAEMPYVFLWHEEVFAALSKNVKDFSVYADGRFFSLRSAVKE